MKNRLLLSFIAFLTLTLPAPVFNGPSEAQARATPDPRIRLFFRQGVEKIFNLEEKEGVAALQKGIDLDPGNPLGQAFLAMAHLFFLETAFEEAERDRRRAMMLGFAEEALARGEKRIAAEPADGQAYFAMALAKITRLRWFIGERRFLSAAREAGNAWDFLRKAREEDPGNHDVLFAVGLLRFHLDHLPGFTRFFSSLFIAPADRKQGLQDLQEAARKGDLLKDLAKAELVSVYLNFERLPEKALPFAQALREKYPRNYNFAFGLGNVLADLRRSEEAFRIAGEIETGIQAGKPPFRPDLLIRHQLLLGRIHFEKGDYARAEDYFRRVIDDPTPRQARIRAWGFVRLGMIADARKERKAAEEYYRKALEVEGGEGLAQTAARQYLQIPYTPTPSP